MTSSSLYAVFLILSLFTVLFLPHSNNPDYKRSSTFVVAIVLLVILNFVVTTPLRIDPRFYLILNPVLVVAGVVAFRSFVSMRSPATNVVYSLGIGIALAACFAALALRLDRQLAATPNETQDQRSYQLLAHLEKSDDSVIASDESDKIALFAGVRTLRLPSEPSQIFEVATRYFPVRYIVLSSHLVNGSTSEKYPPIGYDQYIAFRKSREFEDTYRFVKLLPNGAELYALRR
jgi:hypothetical protein